MEFNHSIVIYSYYGNGWRIDRVEAKEVVPEVCRVRKSTTDRQPPCTCMQALKRAALFDWARFDNHCNYHRAFHTARILTFAYDVSAKLERIMWQLVICSREKNSRARQIKDKFLDKLINVWKFSLRLWLNDKIPPSIYPLTWPGCRVPHIKSDQ